MLWARLLMATIAAMARECLDAPELFGCLPLQPCVPPISDWAAASSDEFNTAIVETLKKTMFFTIRFQIHKGFP